MNLQSPPEIADGGYWYLFEAVPDPVEGGQTPGSIPGIGWCAWYGTVDGVKLVAVRTPEPVSTSDSLDVPVADVLASAGLNTRPYARIGGG